MGREGLIATSPLFGRKYSQREGECKEGKEELEENYSMDSILNTG